MSTFPSQVSVYFYYPFYKSNYILQGTKLETLCIRIASGIVNLISSTLLTVVKVVLTLKAQHKVLLITSA